MSSLPLFLYPLIPVHSNSTSPPPHSSHLHTNPLLSPSSRRNGQLTSVPVSLTKGSINSVSTLYLLLSAFDIHPRLRHFFFFSLCSHLSIHLFMFTIHVLPLMYKPYLPALPTLVQYFPQISLKFSLPLYHQRLSPSTASLSYLLAL